MKFDFKYYGPDCLHGLRRGQRYRGSITCIDEFRRVTGIKVRVGAKKVAFAGEDLNFFKVVVRPEVENAVNEYNEA